MADNVPITAGTGTDIAADDISSIWFQRVKVALGLNGSHVADLTGTAERGAYVDLRGMSSRIQATSAGLTTATTAYSAGDQLGTELSFANAVRDSGGYGTVVTATLLDKAKVNAGVDLYLFDRSVTPAADNAAMAFSDADMAFCVGVVEFRAPKANANNSLALAVNLPLLVKCNVTTLYGHLVTLVGHTFFGAVGDLVTSLAIVQD
jgi:hypothetical protein